MNKTCNTTLICYNPNTTIAFYLSLLIVTILTTLFEIYFDRQWKIKIRDKDKNCLKLSLVYLIIILFIVFGVGTILKILFFNILENG